MNMEFIFITENKLKYSVWKNYKKKKTQRKYSNIKTNTTNIEMNDNIKDDVAIRHIQIFQTQHEIYFRWHNKREKE